MQVTLAVLDRDGSTRGFVSGDTVGALFGKGLDTPSLNVTVTTAEADLAADPDLFDDALIQVLRDGAAWGQPFLVATDDLDLIGNDDGSSTLTVNAHSALMIAAEWQVTPYGGVWKRHSPPVIFFGWQLPDFDDTDWVEPDRVTRGSLTPAVYDDDDGSLVSGDPKGAQPPGWEYEGADWVWVDPDGDSGMSGGLTLFRIGSYTVAANTQNRVASTADEEHTVYRMGPGGGGVIIHEDKQETGYTRSREFDRVQEPGDYFIAAEMTTVDSEGGDGFDALSSYVGAILGLDRVYGFGVVLSTGDGTVRAWRQDKDDPRPGVTAGKILHLLRDWNQAWMTDTSASCHTVTFSFTEDEDSNGDPFDELPEYSKETGRPVTDVMADLGDKVDFDCHLDDVDGHLVIDCYNRKGADLHTTVSLFVGNSGGSGTILSATARRRARTITRLSGLTDDGYFTKVDGTLEDTVTPRSSYIESQQATSVGEGRRLGGRIIDEDARRQSFPLTFTPLSGSVPGVDFDWGDDIEAIDRAADFSQKTVMAWGVNRSGDDEPTCTVELI